ncbi:MAG: DUF3232 domain-containing protein [Oscillospiraceae bacterium]|nr:DUF3232 domain-containing protein [Oscillospiraceae bacterium]
MDSRSMSSNSLNAMNPAGLGNNLPTALFGYDKDAVMSQLSSIYRNAAARERKLSASIEALQKKNELLADTIADYESKLAAARSEIRREAGSNEQYRTNEIRFREELESLKKKVETLEAEKSGKDRELSTMHDRLIKSMNIVNQLKEKLRHGDSVIANLQNTVAVRDAEKTTLSGIISEKDRRLREAGDEIAKRDQIINSYRSGYAQSSAGIETQNLFIAKEREIYDLTNKANALEARIRELESQRSALNSGINTFKERTPAQPAAETGAKAQVPEDIEDRIIRQIEHYSRIADSLKGELDRFGAQIDRFERDIYSRMNNMQYGYQQGMQAPGYPAYGPDGRPYAPQQPYPYYGTYR